MMVMDDNNGETALNSASHDASSSGVTAAPALVIDDCRNPSATSADTLTTNTNSSTCAHCGHENASAFETSGTNLQLLLHGGTLPSQEAKLLRKRDLAYQTSAAQNVDEEPTLSEWIFCDLCRKWFHCVCVNVQEYEVPLIDKFHCPSCKFEHGDSIMKVRRLAHRYAFDDESERELPAQIGTEEWTRHFRTRYNEIPEAPQPSVIQVFDHGTELMANFDFEKGWHKPIKVCTPHGLGLRMPDDPYFDVLDVCRLLSDDITVDTIDVYAQRSYTMSLGRFHGFWRKRVRERLYNILSLEFSGTRLGEIVRSPTFVRRLSWVQKFWPDTDDTNDNNEWKTPLTNQQDNNHVVAGDGQAVHDEPPQTTTTTTIQTDEQQAITEDTPSKSGSSQISQRTIPGPTTESSSSAAAVAASSAAHNSSRPFVEHFCLMGMRGSYTDFHIDFGGSSVWYHVFRGEKVFFVARPSVQNLAEFLRWQRMDPRIRSETFFGDCLPAGEQLYRLHVHERETLFLPSGWIHAVFTPDDSLVFGGNFLHSLSVPMQIKIYEMELVAETEERFKFPFFELCNFYAAKNIAEILKDHTAEGVVAAQLQFDAAKLLLDKCTEWLQTPDGKFTVFTGNVRQLERELGRQRNLRRRICSERALQTATAAFSANASSTSTSASGSPCPTNLSATPLPSETSEDDKLDAQEVFDRSFAVEDEEDDCDLEDEEEAEEEDFEEEEEGDDGCANGGKGWTAGRQQQTDDGVGPQKKLKRCRHFLRKRLTANAAASSAGDGDDRRGAAVLEIESTGPVKLKIKLPCWSAHCQANDGKQSSSPCRPTTIASFQQQRQKRSCWMNKNSADGTVGIGGAVNEDEEVTSSSSPTLDIGAMFSGKSTHGRCRKPSARISESANALDGQAFLPSTEPVSDGDFGQSTKPLMKKGVETKAFWAQFTAEERRQIECADRAGARPELDSCGALFSPLHAKKLNTKKRSKEKVFPNQLSASCSSTAGSAASSTNPTKVPKKRPLNAQQSLAKKLGLKLHRKF